MQRIEIIWCTTFLFSGSLVYPDTNFTESCEGWTNKGGDRDWVIANSSVNDAGTLTGRQGALPFIFFGFIR